MAVLIKNQQEILGEMLEALRAGNLLTNLSAVRSGFVMSQVNARQIRDLFQALEINTSMAYVSTAKGPFLDLLGDLFQLSRFPEQAGSVAAADRNVKFYVTSGTLAQAIPSKVLPAGAEITNADESITYRVLAATPFNDVVTEVFVSVSSTDVGEDQRVGAGELEAHDLGVATVLVTNLAAISNASAIETDDQFRARLIDGMLTRVTGNLASIREAANIVPGLSEVRLRPFANGPGTIQVTAIPVANAASEDLLTRIRANIDAVRSAGTRVDVRGPRFVPTEITILLRFRSDIGEGEKPRVRELAIQAILGYLDVLKIGQTFIVNEMIQRILDVDERILDLEVRCFAFRRRAQVKRNFTPDQDEVLIPDPSLETPIQVI